MDDKDDKAVFHHEPNIQNKTHCCAQSPCFLMLQGDGRGMFSLISSEGIESRPLQRWKRKKIRISMPTGTISFLRLVQTTSWVDDIDVVFTSFVSLNYDRR